MTTRNPIRNAASSAARSLSRSMLESLENRVLLSVAANDPANTPSTVSLRNGTLLVVGSNQGDVITMARDPENLSNLKVTLNGKTSSYGLDSIKFIRAYGLGGSDLIKMDETGAEIDLKLYAYGANGNDTLVGASGDDVLVGGRGNDLLQGLAGNDQLEGNTGDDRLLGGDGKDTLNGGAGKDTINSGAGKDAIFGKEKIDAIDTDSAASVTSLKKIHYNGTPIIKRRGRRGRPADFFGTVTGLTPQQIRTAYNFGDLTNSSFTNRGAGQTVAVVTAFHYPTAMNDLNFFSSTFGLPQVTKKTFSVQYASGNQPIVDRSWAAEAALDIESVHSIAPEAKIILVEADTDTVSDLYNAVQKAVKALQPTGGVVSMSFGVNEIFSDQGLHSQFTNVSTGNVSFVAAAGDDSGVGIEPNTGLPGPAVNHPAADEEVLSVGGTFLPVDANGNRTADESTWTDTGGGMSEVFDRPSYQDGLVIEGAAIGPGRAVPDVAYVADPFSGIAVYSTTPLPGGDTGWSAVGGTSVGAAQWAGLIALANQKRVAGGLDVIGNGQLNNYIYGIARKFGSTTFNDIVDGGNFFHNAEAGYDLVTGWGTPKATALIDQLAVAQSKNRVSTRVDIPFHWTGSFTRDLTTPLLAGGTFNFAGTGDANVQPDTADITFVQTAADNGDVSIDGTALTRSGNLVVGRGTGSVLLSDGTPGLFLLQFNGRLSRVNGKDKITGEFYAVSHRGKIIQQGGQAIFRGTFNSITDSK